MASEIGPDYRQVIDLFRGMITSGKWPVGQPIPSTAQLKEAFPQFGLTTLRRAVRQLQEDGVLEGHPGKRVFVKAMPADADTARMSIEDLRAMYDDLHHRVAHLETDVMDLRSGHGLSIEGGHHDQEERRPVRRRPGR